MSFKKILDMFTEKDPHRALESVRRMLGVERRILSKLISDGRLPEKMKANCRMAEEYTYLAIERLGPSKPQPIQDISSAVTLGELEDLTSMKEEEEEE